MASRCSVCPIEMASTPCNWCSDCDDLLCQSCTGHHKRSSASRDHKVIPYEDYQKIPPFILTIKPFCTEHHEKYLDFCKTHDTPICNTCLKHYHRKCEDVPKIEDVVNQVKYSELFEKTIVEMEAMCRTFKQIADVRNKNLKQLEMTHKEMKEVIEQKFDNLIKHLISLKEKTHFEMEAMYDKLTNDISEKFNTAQTKEKELQAILEQKDEIMKYASNYQMFIAVKEMETKMDINLKELLEDEKLMECNLKLHINQTIENTIKTAESLGDIEVTKSPSDVSIRKTSSRLMQAVKEAKTPGSSQLQLLQTIDLERGHMYHGCCTLSSGLMVIADTAEYDDEVRVHKFDGSIRSTINFDKSEGVRDVSPVDNVHVAVSHPRSGTVSIINVTSEEVVKKIKIEEKVTGMCCKGRDLVCCVIDKCIVKLNIDSQKLDTVVKDESVSFDSNVEVSSNRVCYTCSYPKHTVTVLDTQFNVIFTYKDEAVVLKWPRGVTIDDNGYIYVTGFWSHNLVAISPDGKLCHQLLGKEHGLQNPTAVHYDSSTKKVMIINRQGPVFLYSVR